MRGVRLRRTSEALPGRCLAFAAVRAPKDVVRNRAAAVREPLAKGGLVAVNCPMCQGPTTVVKTEPTSSGAKARLRRCTRDGQFWTRSVEKFDHWLPATAIPVAGNGSATANAVGSQLGGRGGLPLGVSSLPSKRSGARARVEPPRFAEFWAIYPRHVARIKAVEIWIKCELDQHADAIIGAIQLQRPEFMSREPDKVPHAATWLNQERWKDEVDRRPRPVGRPARSDGNVDNLRDWLAKGTG